MKQTNFHPEDRQNVIGVPGVLPVETVGTEDATDGENEFKTHSRTESEVIEGTWSMFSNLLKV